MEAEGVSRRASQVREQDMQMQEALESLGTWMGAVEAAGRFCSGLTVVFEQDHVSSRDGVWYMARRA